MHTDCVYVHMLVCLHMCRLTVAIMFHISIQAESNRLAPNEPITGSSIWCVLYGSPGSAISVDESWERCGSWAGQRSEKPQTCICSHTQRCFTMTQSWMDGTKEELQKVGGALKPPHFMSLWNSYESTSDGAKCAHWRKPFLIDEKMLVADQTDADFQDGIKYENTATDFHLILTLLIKNDSTSTAFYRTDAYNSVTKACTVIR